MNRRWAGVREGFHGVVPWMGARCWSAVERRVRKEVRENMFFQGASI